MQRRHFLLSTAAAMAAVLPLRAAQAQQAVPIRFDANWQTLTFPRRTPMRYAMGGGTLMIEGDSGSSLVYLPAPAAARTARAAEWSWTVSRSVPPTDLSKKGGDDRNLSVYFVFMDAAAAQRLAPDTPPQRLLSNRSARVLIYVWGGDHAPGSLLPSPYLRGRGFTIALRPAGTGEGTARADLAADYTRAFGASADALVGLAVSADCDDTATQLRASLSDLTLI